MIVEYGSEFSLCAGAIANANAPILDSLNMVYLRSGRDALAYVASIVRAKVSTVLMPALCCSSMVDPFLASAYNIVFYDVGETLQANMLDLEKKASDHPGSILLFMNYYGLASIEPDFVNLLKSRYDLIVLKDATHDWLDYDFFSDSVPDYAISSLRKWMPLPDGAFVFSKQGEIESAPEGDDAFSSLRLEAMQLKAEYLASGKADLKPRYLSALNQCDRLLGDFLPPRGMSAISRKLFASYDLDSIRIRRRENSSVLAIGLRDLGLQTVHAIGGSSLYVPFVHSNRDFLQKELARRSVYCPVLWPLPSMAKEISPSSARFTDTMLCVPCDQRYCKSDMNTILSVIKEVLACDITTRSLQ